MQRDSLVSLPVLVHDPAETVKLVDICHTKETSLTDFLTRSSIIVVHKAGKNACDKTAEGRERER